MEITCITEKLKSAVSITNRYTVKHPSLPELKYILCTFIEKKIILRATNLSVGIEITVPGVVKKEGVIAIDGATLLQAIAGKDDSETTLSVDNEVLTVISGKYKTVLKTFPHEDFPTIPKINTNTISLQTNTFVTGLTSVVYAASVSDIKPEIASVYIYPEEETITFVATDTFRLAEKTIKTKESLYGVIPLLIPVKNAIEIAKTLPENQTTEVSYSETQITFSTNNIYITSKVTQGSFPNYKQIIPNKVKTEAVFLTKEIDETLKSLSGFSDKFNQITILFSPKKNQCVFSAENSDCGKQTVVLDGALSGEDVSININARYILDMLPSVSADSISFNLVDESKPLIIRPIGDSTFTYLVMPIHKG